jgi:periplasmic protein TonB
MNSERPHPSLNSSADRVSNAGDDRFNHFLQGGFEEKPIWTDLYESLHDALFPSRLPPLELTSTPIPTPDRMAVKTNPWAIGTATLANGGLLAVLLCMGLSTTINHLPKPLPIDDIHLKDFTLFAPPTAQSAHGGGGGGSNSLTDPTVGRTPRQDMMPIVPSQPQMLDNPRLPVDPAIAVPIEIKLPDNSSLPNIGVYKSPNVSLVSGGQGKKAGIGTGSDGGDGPGRGSGYGPGFDGGTGGSVYTPGVGGVSNPIPLLTPEAEFSDEARRNKYQGVCMITVIVDAHGFPRNPRVVQHLGMGLDEKALEAVQKYRFKPAMKDGKPVASIISVAVNFKLF